ncbi:MAG: hypothetical protein HYX94_11855 [Chloroflexi bacterium]|nr:hypothetical protein [Chloroflexota bacterium]
MGYKQEIIEASIKVVQNWLDRAGVERVTQLAPEDREQMILELRVVLDKPVPPPPPEE